MFKTTLDVPAYNAMAGVLMNLAAAPVALDANKANLQAWEDSTALRDLYFKNFNLRILPSGEAALKLSDADAGRVYRYLRALFDRGLIKGNEAVDLNNLLWDLDRYLTDVPTIIAGGENVEL